MLLTKRSMRVEEYNRSKLLECIKSYVGDHSHPMINIEALVSKIETRMRDRVTTRQLSECISETAASCVSVHPGFEAIAVKAFVSMLHKDTLDRFSEKIKVLHSHGMISDGIFRLTVSNSDMIDRMIEYRRDELLTYSGLRALCRSYLLRANGELVEGPQDMFMRVSLSIHGDDFDKVKETYDLMSMKYFVHGMSTLFNAGIRNPKMNGRFVMSIKNGGSGSVMNALEVCAKIARDGGDVGINISRVSSWRAKAMSATPIGIISMMRMFESFVRHFSYSGDGRKVPTIAFFLEPWHAEVWDFIEMGRDARTLGILTALWIPDLFMRRVESNKSWSLFCPSIAEDLNDVYGEEFDALYAKYEGSSIRKETVSARSLWKRIVECQMEVGTPYVLYKDSCNRKNGQCNIDVLRCSSLTSEVLEATGNDTLSTCNSALLALPSFYEHGNFNFKKFEDVIRVAVLNMNTMIDKCIYPSERCRTSSTSSRPIGLGVQGMADLLALMGYPFESEKAKELNKRIFETMYFSSVKASMELAKLDGPCRTFQGSPASKGILQFDMWGERPNGNLEWAWLKKEVMKHGLRNSLVIALAPSTLVSQIFGFSECFEPYSSNFHIDNTDNGTFRVVNPQLVNDLLAMGLWSYAMRDKIVENSGGSIQNIPSIPNHIKELYKTAWEMKMKNIIDMSADRGPFIDHTQSLNLFIENPTYNKITSMHFYGWKRGLKTGMHHLYTTPMSSSNRLPIVRDVFDSEEKRVEYDNENGTFSFVAARK